MPAPCRSTAATIQLHGAIIGASPQRWPFRHWLLKDVLPEGVAEVMRLQPVPRSGFRNASGQRTACNPGRVFCTPDARASAHVWSALGRLFQDARTVAAFARLCAADLDGSFLRIESCLDQDGFWLEPHTDIGAKKLTLIIYLSDEPGSRAWGTDLLRADGSLACRIEAEPNTGILFVPGPDTWHGFARRPIEGVRRSLIVNYVGPEWRPRQELAYPDAAIRLRTPVGSAAVTPHVEATGAMTGARRSTGL